MRCLLLLLLATGCATGRPAATPVPADFAARNVERGAYREVRVAAQWIDLVAGDGRRDRVEAPPTRGGAEGRQDVLFAARAAQRSGMSLRIVEVDADDAEIPGRMIGPPRPAPIAR